MTADVRAQATAKPMVVIIDDMRDNIDLIDECLSGEYSVRFATSGLAGIKLVRARLPDLVLLDIMMPDMDGYDACRILKSDPDTRDIPIIFVTARSDVDDEAMGLRLGAADYITKPFVPALMRARISIHIRLKQLVDRLEHQSATDALTDLPNRRCFDETLQREWVRGMRSGLPLSIVMIDIDFFKAFNDQYGHQTGDDCLRKVAKALASSVPRLGGDIVARYGGEEFVAILVDTDLRGARTVAERLRTSVTEIAIPHEQSSISKHVTVSVGVASSVPVREQSPTDLVELADGKLYLAKQAGRNLVRW